MTAFAFLSCQCQSVEPSPFLIFHVSLNGPSCHHHHSPNLFFLTFFFFPVTSWHRIWTALRPLAPSPRAPSPRRCNARFKCEWRSINSYIFPAGLWRLNTRTHASTHTHSPCHVQLCWPAFNWQHWKNDYHSLDEHAVPQNRRRATLSAMSSSFL